MVLGLSVAGVGEVVGAFLGGVGSEQFATYLVIEPGPSWWGWFLPKVALPLPPCGPFIGLLLLSSLQLRGEFELLPIGLHFKRVDTPVAAPQAG
jgi:hypothetical protein